MFRPAFIGWLIGRAAAGLILGAVQLVRGAGYLVGVAGGLVAKAGRRQDGYIALPSGAMAKRNKEKPPKITLDNLQGWAGDGMSRKYVAEIKEREAGQPCFNMLVFGQQQRGAIAPAITSKPALILDDEPIGNLDTANRAQVPEVLAELNREGAAIAMITPSPSQADLTKRHIDMPDGHIVVSATRVI